MKSLCAALACLALCGCVIVPADEHGRARSSSGKPMSTVCHKGTKTMELPDDAVAAHLHHGDHPGPC